MLNEMKQNKMNCPMSQYTTQSPVPAPKGQSNNIIVMTYTKEYSKNNNIQHYKK